MGVLLIRELIQKYHSDTQIWKDSPSPILFVYQKVFSCLAVALFSRDAAVEAYQTDRPAHREVEFHKLRRSQELPLQSEKAAVDVGICPLY